MTDAGCTPFLKRCSIKAFERVFHSFRRLLVGLLLVAAAVLHPAANRPGFSFCDARPLVHALTRACSSRCCLRGFLLPVSLLPSLLLRAYNTHKFCARTPRERILFLLESGPRTRFHICSRRRSTPPVAWLASCAFCTSGRRPPMYFVKSFQHFNKHDGLESRLHSSFCVIFLFRRSSELVL